MLYAMTQNQLQSQAKVILLQEHIERLLQERKDTRKELDRLRELAEQQQETIRRLRRSA